MRKRKKDNIIRKTRLKLLQINVVGFRSGQKQINRWTSTPKMRLLAIVSKRQSTEANANVSKHEHEMWKTTKNEHELSKCVYYRKKNRYGLARTCYWNESVSISRSESSSPVLFDFVFFLRNFGHHERLHRDQSVLVVIIKLVMVVFKWYENVCLTQKSISR